jgi:hypothetical protein
MVTLLLMYGHARIPMAAVRIPFNFKKALR